MPNEVASHYTQTGLSLAIQTALKSVVGDERSASIDDLAPVDEFHIGGRGASQHLFDQLDLSPADRVLDVGAGIGGTARFVAHTYGSKVTGIDLTPEFCSVAGELTGLVGLSELVSVEQGSALDMPYDDNSFDAAYMMHVGMNISDKPALFLEIRRVLRPGGVFAIYDVIKGPGDGTMQYPVPWATTADTSFLASPDEMETYLKLAGFRVESMSDRTEFAVKFFESVMTPAGTPPPPIGLQLILGESARDKIKNMISNVSNGLCGPWEFISR